MRTTLYILALICVYSASLLAQQDSLFVNFDQKYGITLDYPIQKSQTIFGLSHVFGSNVQTTHELNPEKDLSILALNEVVKFQINNKIIAPSPSSQHVQPLYYTVEAHKTMYTIARVYAGQDVKTIMELNNKNDYSLSVGEPLLIGYIDTPYVVQVDIKNLAATEDDLLETSIPMPLITPSALAVETSQDTLLNSIDSTQLNQVAELLETSKKERGLAMWEATEYGTKELLVMHPTARINSDIALYNPMMKKTVHAKVVGTLPKNSYPQNISVVISPAVASALGALDKKFLVEITYTE